jgi:hypothetical protein
VVLSPPVHNMMLPHLKRDKKGRKEDKNANKKTKKSY